MAELATAVDPGVATVEAAADTIAGRGSALEPAIEADAAQRKELRITRSMSLYERARAVSGSSAFERMADIALGLAVGVLVEGRVPQSDKAPPTLPADRSDEVRALSESMRNIVDLLPEPERQVISSHYLDGMSFDAIAMRDGLSVEEVSAIHAQAVAALRERQHRKGRLSLRC